MVESFEFCSILFSNFKALELVSENSAKNANSEHGIFISKHNSTCHRKIPTYRFMYKTEIFELSL